MRTDVVIVGAGPAGLLLGHLLRDAGVPFVILEERSRDYVLGRIRAGVLEQGSVDILTRLGLDSHLRERGLVHNGIYLQYERQRHHVDFRDLVGRTVTIYGQQQLVQDLVEEHESAGSALLFEASEVTPNGFDGPNPRVTYRHDGELVELDCELIVGADGYHGVCRASIPAGELKVFERSYPFGWLGILADVAPSTDDLIYALHADGFAMHSMRSMSVSRLYLQVRPDESIDDWSDSRVWDGLHTRLGIDGWTLTEGPVTEKSITPMRSFVVSTLRSGRLFLAGDAGHIVPPTGAKGLNSAIADVALLGQAILDERAGDSSGLNNYSDRALRRQWKVQQFSQWMTEMLHVHHDIADDTEREFRYRSQLGQLEYLTGSLHAQRSLAEQYAGLPFEEA